MSTFLRRWSGLSLSVIFTLALAVGVVHRAGLAGDSAHDEASCQLCVAVHESGVALRTAAVAAVVLVISCFFTVSITGPLPSQGTVRRLWKSALDPPSAF